MQQRRVTYERARFEQQGIAGIALFGHQRYSRAHKRLPNHAHPHCIELCLLAGGRQCFVVNDRRYWMTGGQAFLTFPGEAHSTGDHPMERGELFWLIIDLREEAGFLGLNRPLGEAMRRALGSLQRRLFDVPAEAFDAARALERELGSEAPRGIYLQDRLNSLLARVVEAAGDETLAAERPLQPVLRFIDDQLDQPLSVERLAGAAGLSPSRFKTVFRQQIGIPPGEYVARRRIERARQRLRESDESITAIALEVGFSTPQYFACVFRRLTGITPRQYRSGQSAPLARRSS